MALIRWQPVSDFATFGSQLERFFDDALGAADPSTRAWRPVVDVFSRGDDLVLRAELPGVDGESIDVNVDGDVLTLQGERGQESERQEGDSYLTERVFGQFRRSFTLPTEVDTQQIKATYRDGVLEVVMPKSQESRARKITVDAA